MRSAVVEAPIADYGFHETRCPPRLPQPNPYLANVRRVLLGVGALELASVVQAHLHRPNRPGQLALRHLPAALGATAVAGSNT
jgi:hypothetical protein